jgi:hypothetical protein
MRLSLRVRAAGVTTRALVLLLALATVVEACEEEPQPQPPAPDAIAAVREAADRTVKAGAANIGIQVSSPSEAYSVRGAIELATASFRVRVRVRSAPYTHFIESLEAIGMRGETFQIVRKEPGFENLAPTGCAFDPHSLVGSYGGAISVQEAMALVGVATRLLQDGARTAIVLQRKERPAATYRVIVDPSAVSDADLPRSDEWRVVNPRRLARHLGPAHVTVDSRGLIRRLALDLRSFPPPKRGPGVGRERRRERVSVTVSLSDFGRTFDLRPPACMAME